MALQSLQCGCTEKVIPKLGPVATGGRALVGCQYMHLICGIDADPALGTMHVEDDGVDEHGDVLPGEYWDGAPAGTKYTTCKEDTGHFWCYGTVSVVLHHEEQL